MAVGSAGEVSLRRSPQGRHSWFHLSPTNQPEGTAEPRSQAVGASRKMYLRKGKTPEGSGGGKGKRNNPVSTKVRAEGAGDVLQGRDFAATCGRDYAGAAIHIAAHGRPHTGAGVYFPKEKQPMESL